MEGQGRVAFFGPDGMMSVHDAGSEELALLTRQAWEGMGVTPEAARVMAQMEAAITQVLGGGAGGAHPAPSGSSGGQQPAAAGAAHATMLTGLRQAVARGDIAQARQLLANGEDVNGHDGNGLTAVSERRRGSWERERGWLKSGCLVG